MGRRVTCPERVSGVVFLTYRYCTSHSLSMSPLECALDQSPLLFFEVTMIEEDLVCGSFFLVLEVDLHKLECSCM